MRPERSVPGARSRALLGSVCLGLGDGVKPPKTPARSARIAPDASTPDDRCACEVDGDRPREADLPRRARTPRPHRTDRRSGCDAPCHRLADPGRGGPRRLRQPSPAPASGSGAFQDAEARESRPSAGRRPSPPPPGGPALVRTVRGRIVFIASLMIVLVLLLLVEGFTTKTVGASSTGPGASSGSPLAGRGPILTARGNRLVSVGPKSGRRVALTFDDGPDPRWT